MFTPELELIIEGNFIKNSNLFLLQGSKSHYNNHLHQPNSFICFYPKFHYKYYNL